MADQLKDNRGAEALRRSKLNTYEIADAIDADQGQVSRWRRGVRKPNAGWRVRLSRRFKIGIGWWDDPPSVSDREIRTAAR